MPLSPGSRLGVYEVLSPLGAGGMGEVYRVRDTRLGREVAIKALPAERLKDEHRRRRFLQEARTLSSLSHPNIVTIHEIESANGIDFIVMELVRGASLDALISKNGMRVDELLRLAIPMADALAAAHARGIVHRDLKPANVVVRNDGTVKVLDFGLAKLMEVEETLQAETATDLRDAGLTAAGRIVGTLGYMAPEQAAGGRVDARSDVFNFGAMLYEMATGRRAFDGDTPAEVLAAVVTAQPQPPSELVAGLPRELERVILRCLRKEPERRYQSMLDVRNELQDIQQERESPRVTNAHAADRGHRPMVLAGLAAAAIVGALAWTLMPGDQPQLSPMRVVPLTTLDGYEMMPTLSPDGHQVAFAWNGDKESENVDIYVSLLGSPAVHRLTTDPAMDVFPRWSPDGRRIAFVRQLTDHAGRIYVTSPLGGPERKVSDFEVHFDRFAAFGHLAWSRDGRYIAAARPSQQEAGQSTGIYLIPVDGGEPRRLTTTRAPATDRDPAISPDGRRLAYLNCDNCCWGECEVMSLELDSRVQPAGEPRRWTSRGPQLEGLTWTGDGRSLVFGALIGGTVFKLNAVSRSQTLWRVEANGGDPQRLELAGFNARKPSIGSSGDRLVFGRSSERSNIHQVGPDGVTRAISASSALDFGPAFSPDGRHIAFCSTRSGQAEIWLAAADGTGARPLAQGCGAVPAWAPDGRAIVFARPREIWTVDTEGGNLRQVVSDLPFSFPRVAWSSDGQWIYFNKGGYVGSNVWRVPTGGGPEQQVTRSGGFKAAETPDGKSLVYQQGEDRQGLPVLIVPLAGGSPRQLVSCAYGFSVGPSGVYYYPCRPSGPPVPLSPGAPVDVRLVNPATGHDRLIATLSDLLYSEVFWGPVVSPDGRTLLYAKDVSPGEDLMMIENFR